MPPVKRRAKGAKAPPNRWTRAEIDVLLQCLGSDEFLSKHAKTLQKRQFPPFSLRDACVKENEYHGVCVALSQEILNQAGDHNNFNLRPFASIASKILDMTAKAKASNQGLEAQMLFDAFDVDAFMASSGPLGPEPPAAADLAAASSSGAASSSTSKGSAEGGEPPKEQEAAKEDEEYDDTYVAPVRDPRNITFQTRILNPHLVCTLCMGYFNDACTIIECLHTFCRACIMRHFRESQVCPTCDSNLGTNPRDLVRTDRTLQSIVDKVFPQFAAQASTAATAAAAAATAATAAAKRPASPPASTASPRPGKAARPGVAAGGSAAAAEEVQEEISFSLQEEVDESAATNVRLEKPYLRTSARLTVAHLKKYLAKKMKASAEVAADLQIMCCGVALPLEISLDAIVRTHWQQASEDLVLTYRLMSPAEGVASSGSASSGGASGAAAAAEVAEPKAEAPAEPEEPEEAARQPATGGGGGSGDVAMGEAGEGEGVTA